MGPPGRGLLVALEGLDGVGKSTLATELAAALGARLARTPEAELGEARARIDASWAPIPRRLFYATSVIQVGHALAADLEAGRHVVVDRWFASTLAYAELDGTRAAVEPLAPHVRAADLTIYLELPEPQRRARLAQRGAGREDLATYGPAERLRRAYDAALTHPSCGRIVRLDAQAPVNELVRRAAQDIALASPEPVRARSLSVSARRAARVAISS